MNGHIPNHLRHHRRGMPKQGRGRYAGGVHYRGVVLKSYFPDDPQLAGKLGGNSGANVGVTCDVYIMELRRHGILKRVPILRAIAGLNDVDTWVPRGSSQTISGGTLVVSPEGGSEFATPTQDFDGDHVVICFMENDLMKPMIVGFPDHPNTKRKPSITDGIKFRRTLRGITFTVLDNGDIAIDTTLASDGSISATGDEIPTAGAGNVRIVLPATGVAFEVNGGGTLSNHLLGSIFLQAFAPVLTEIAAGLAAVPFATPQLTAFLANVNASLSALPASGAPYLSVHSKTD